MTSKEKQEAEKPLFSPLESSLIFHSIWILAAFTLFTVCTAVFINPLAMPDFTDIYATIGMQPMNAAGFAGVFALFVGTRPSSRVLAFFSVLGVILEFIYLANLKPGLIWEARLINAGGGLFLAGMAGLIYLSLFSPSLRERKLARAMVRVSLILVLYPRFSGPLYLALYKMTPLVYDAYGLTVEKSLGFVPSLEMAKLQLLIKPLGRIAFNFYNRLPLFMCIAFLLCMHNPKRVYNNLFFGFLWAGLFGYFFFPILPMVGVDLFVGTPPWPLGEFPQSFQLKPVEAPANYPRSCFPSLHGAWILMIYFSVYRISKWINMLFLVVVFWTVVGTMAAHIGHYAIDLIASVPFALANTALCTTATANNKAPRLLSASLGLAATGILALSIRLFPVFLSQHGWLFWGSSLVIIGLCFYAERVLGNTTLRDLAESDDKS